MQPLGRSECFTKAHIETFKQEAPAALAEQAIRSLELVAELSQTGLDFTFKGGNSLLLILDTPRRFSIDVDITTAESRERIGEALDTCIKKHGLFSRVEHRPHKTKPWLPMTSYYLYYDSAVEKGETFIMLDAMLKPSLYKLQKKKASCGQLFKCDTEVKLPLPGSILGDKLLTLGPKTLGIPFNKNKEAQRLKHVHDAALLAALKPDLTSVREALHICYNQELELQDRPLPLLDVLKDSLRFLAFSTIAETEPDLPKEPEAGLREMVVGRAPFEAHLFVKNYPWSRLRKDAALCAAALTSAIIPDVTQETFVALLDEEDPLKIWKRVMMISGGLL